MMFYIRHFTRFLWASSIPNMQWAWYSCHHSRYSTGSFLGDYWQGVHMLWEDVITALSLNRRAQKQRGKR